MCSVVAKVWPSTWTSVKPTARSRGARVRGRDGWARWPSQARRTRSMWAASKAASGTGRAVASARCRRTSPAPSVRRRARARVWGLASTPVTDPVGPTCSSRSAREEPGPQPDRQDPLTGPGPQGLADQPAAAQDVAGPVELLELGGEAVVEDELAHGVLPCRVGCPRGGGRPPPAGPRPPPDPPRTRPAAQVSQVTGSAAT